MGREGIAHAVCVVFLILFLSVSAIPTFPCTANAHDSELRDVQANVSSDNHKQISVRIEPEQMEIKKIEDFDWITLPECSCISTQGHPALPIKPIVVKLPRNTEVVKINVVKTTSIGVPGKYMVAPALKPRVIYDRTETKVVDDGAKFEALSEKSLFSEPLLEIYNSSIPYPRKLFDFYASKGREYNYVMIYFYPVKFAPLEGRLTLVNEATFDVEYTIEAESTQSLSDPSLDEVIITALVYESEANTLAEWRNATQVRTAVFTTDLINSTYEGVDLPKRIRNFIGDMFNKTGIKYVLLFGDVDDVPTRFAYVPDGDDVGGPDGIEVPTDYYYECLEGTWDPNGDGKYADLANDDYTQIDFIPEVSVGRLSVNNNATASQVVNKIIQYEKNIDPTWSKRMILAGTDPFTEYAGAEGEILKDYIEDIVVSNFTSFTKLYETQGTLPPTAISDNVNSGSGAVNFAGHGHYGLWSLGTAGSYTNSDAAGLTNGNKLPIVAAMACLTAGFDSRYNTGNCIGEEFLRNPNGGSAAYVGSTRLAWGYVSEHITEGLAGELDWRFWESLKLGISQPGPMLTEAKIRYIASHPLNTTHKVDNDYYYLDEKTVLEYVLLGDPVLFAEKPSTLVKTYKDSAYSKESKFFTVNDVVYIEADVRGYGGANISYANVYAELYVDGALEANITLAHLGEDSNLYRGSWASNSSSSVGVYSVNVTVSSPYESAPGSNCFHLYSGLAVSAYRLDWDEDGMDDYVLESEHLISVFDGTEYTYRLIIYLYQKDTDTAYTFGKISDPDSVGKGEIATSGMKNVTFYSFFLQEGENLVSSYLRMIVNLTKAGPPVEQRVLFSDGFESGDFIAGGWSLDSPPPDIGTEDVYEGNYSVGKKVYDGYGGNYHRMWRTVDTTDCINITFGYARAVEDAGPGTVDFTAEYSTDGGATWIELETVIDTDDVFTYVSWSLPTEAENNPSFVIRFGGIFGRPVSASANDWWVDAINVTGIYLEPLQYQLNIAIDMRTEDVDYLAYKLHNFDQNISDIEDIFSGIAGTLGLSVGDDRYHLEDGTDGLITSLTADQWNNYAISNYVCVYDNSTSADPVNDIVMAWVRFNETQAVAYQDVGLWNDAGYATEGLRIRYNASQAMATDEVNYMLIFTKGNWKTIHQWMPTIESGQYPDPNFMSPLGFDLNLRVRDWDLTDNIQGAYVYVDSDVKISDANGWANWTAVTGTVYIKVKYYGAWVNGTFSVTMDSDKTIDVQCRLYDVICTVKPNNTYGVVTTANVTVFNATFSGTKIKSGITANWTGQVTLTNLPNSTLTFIVYAKSDYSVVIANVTRLISWDEQSEIILADQNYGMSTHDWVFTILPAGRSSILSAGLTVLPVTKMEERKRRKLKGGER